MEKSKKKKAGPDLKSVFDHSFDLVFQDLDCELGKSVSQLVAIEAKEAQAGGNSVKNEIEKETGKEIGNEIGKETDTTKEETLPQDINEKSMLDAFLEELSDTVFGRDNAKAKKKEKVEKKNKKNKKKTLRDKSDAVSTPIIEKTTMKEAVAKQESVEEKEVKPCPQEVPSKQVVEANEETAEQTDSRTELLEASPIAISDILQTAQQDLQDDVEVGKDSEQQQQQQQQQHHRTRNSRNGDVQPATPPKNKSRRAILSTSEETGTERVGEVVEDSEAPLLLNKKAITLKTKTVRFAPSRKP